MPHGEIDAAIDAALSRIANVLGIRSVWRWDGHAKEDASWHSTRLSAGDPQWFGDLASLPPSIRRRLDETGDTCSVLAVPLADGGVAPESLFGVFSDPSETWGERGGELHVLAAVFAAVLQRKRASAALEASDQLKGAILDSLPAHVAVVDRGGVIIAVNDAWSALGHASALPMGTSAVRGTNFLDVFEQSPAVGDGSARDAVILIEQACRGERTGRQVEFLSKAAGKERWFLMTAEPLRRLEGGAVVTYWEITERKLNEIALRESEDRFRRMADAMPVSIWMSDADGEFTYFNKHWVQITGRSIEELSGEGWLESVHPDDRAGCLDLYLRAFHSRESFRMEYRLRRYDGAYRWLLDTGTPRYGTDAAFHGFVGGCFDITEQKDAERMLRDLSHRLMRAQDEERRRIARELHDHLSQQLALLAVDLQQLVIKRVPTRDAVASLQEAWRRTTEIASDVHAISHRLHPSKMEALGLVATAQGHCRDISRQSLPVHFSHADMPSGINPDRALSVFRILEEALSNVLRHSAATEARVTLTGTDTHIVLRVADNGRGFVDTGRQPSGIGLVSMRERLQLLEGTLSLTSVPAKGTVLEARVPIARVTEPAASGATPTTPRAASGEKPAISA
jgi:PAS domain S-box-containing protein